MITENMAAFFKAAGIVAFPLLAFSVVSLALIGERLYFWFRVNQRQPKVMKDTLKIYRREPATAIRKLKQNVDLPMCRICLEALEWENPNPDEFRLAMESAAQAEIPVLKRFNIVFDTIIAASPLLGLLGTVLGLMTSFASINLGEIGGSKSIQVSAGISEALASTAMGLVVALVTLLFANAFRAFYIRQLAAIQEYSGQFELIYRQHQQLEDTKQKFYATA
ncbi:MotA/TolQ/ExbB proton channel family protein [Merismopedia glauca]|uniref:Biopolymer transporter ExbB n=1 Tax=Merismopedia glauca CCAP 1448/3 TaxID=1296344 RepID=A0A2T1C0P8_9CYAN|nr:MotA/TolQ/ExbB proton channel family protein [Merismopedia glauca]PSB01748.1 biopolymer transporter ExbB [Merismopedia glauca CCAP 1448/3]